MNALDRPWVLIAEREITTKLRDKTFLGSTAVMLLIVLVAVIVPALIAGRGGADKIAVVDDAGAKVVQQASTTKGGDGYEVTRVADQPAAEKAVINGDVKAALLPGQDGYVVLGKDRLDSGLESALREAASTVGMEANAAKAGLTPAELHAGTKVEAKLLNPGPLPDIVSDFVNIGLALVFYMTALGFGMMIAQSVVQEKESRVVEILAAAVPIRSLLWGKVLGSTVLALSQIVVIAGASLIGLLATDQVRHPRGGRAGGGVVRGVLRARVRRAGRLVGGGRVAGDTAGGPRIDHAAGADDPDDPVLLLGVRRVVGQDHRVVRADRVVHVDAGPDADRGRPALAAAARDRDPARHHRADRPPGRPAVRTHSAADRSAARVSRGHGAGLAIAHRLGRALRYRGGPGCDKTAMLGPCVLCPHLDYGLDA